MQYHFSLKRASNFDLAQQLHANRVCCFAFKPLASFSGAFALAFRISHRMRARHEMASSLGRRDWNGWGPQQKRGGAGATRKAAAAHQRPSDPIRFVFLFSTTVAMAISTGSAISTVGVGVFTSFLLLVESRGDG